MEILSKQHEVEFVWYEHIFQYKTDPPKEVAELLSRLSKS